VGPPPCGASAGDHCLAVWLVVPAGRNSALGAATGLVVTKPAHSVEPPLKRCSDGSAIPEHRDQGPHQHTRVPRRGKPSTVITPFRIVPRAGCRNARSRTTRLRRACAPRASYSSKKTPDAVHHWSQRGTRVKSSSPSSIAMNSFVSRTAA
jgi:hypothetical protein